MRNLVRGRIISTGLAALLLVAVGTVLLLFGCSEQVLIKDNSLSLGTWQAVFFCEFDGPRSRKVVLQIRGE